MPSPLIDTPEALDASTALAIQSRREKLLRIVEDKGIRIRVALRMYGRCCHLCACRLLGWRPVSSKDSRYRGLHAHRLCSCRYKGGSKEGSP
jgi:hypothetical protein